MPSAWLYVKEECLWGQEIGEGRSGDGMEGKYMQNVLSLDAFLLQFNMYVAFWRCIYLLAMYLPVGLVDF